MKRAFLVLLLSIATLIAEPPKLTDAVRKDIQLMRERVSLPGGTGAVYATDRATAAARRVFATLPLVGMTRQEVVAVLGEASEFVAASSSSPAGRLLYRFDHGFDGVEFILALDASSRVIKVSSQGYD
jgi:hypothetical protein